jgi:hypothetical protein
VEIEEEDSLVVLMTTLVAMGVFKDVEDTISKEVVGVEGTKTLEEVGMAHSKDEVGLIGVDLHRIRIG